MTVNISDILLIISVINFIGWIFFSILNNIQYKHAKPIYNKAPKVAAFFMIIFFIVFIISFVMLFGFNLETPDIKIQNPFSKINLLFFKILTY